MKDYLMTFSIAEEASVIGAIVIRAATEREAYSNVMMMDFEEVKNLDDGTRTLVCAGVNIKDGHGIPIGRFLMPTEIAQHTVCLLKVRDEGARFGSKNHDGPVLN